MNYEEFKNHLDQHSLTLSEFAKITGLSESGIYKWKNYGVPSWVKSWMDLFTQVQNLQKIKELAQAVCESNQ